MNPAHRAWSSKIQEQSLEIFSPLFVKLSMTVTSPCSLVIYFHVLHTLSIVLSLAVLPRFAINFLQQMWPIVMVFGDHIDKVVGCLPRVVFRVARPV
jgi:hypothetical protein